MNRAVRLPPNELLRIPGHKSGAGCSLQGEEVCQRYIDLGFWNLDTWVSEPKFDQCNVPLPSNKSCITSKPLSMLYISQVAKMQNNFIFYKLLFFLMFRFFLLALVRLGYLN